MSIETQELLRNLMPAIGADTKWGRVLDVSVREVSDRFYTYRVGVLVDVPDVGSCYVAAEFTDAPASLDPFGHPIPDVPFLEVLEVVTALDAYIDQKTSLARGLKL
jgi:hypothetical protein